MSADAKGLQINVMGREFRVACPENEQKGLLEAVDYLNKKMDDIRDNGKVIGIERIAIMAALNIAHELLEARTRGAPASSPAADGFDIAFTVSRNRQIIIFNRRESRRRAENQN